MMFYCRKAGCRHPEMKNRECFSSKGESCENKVYGCPKCHSNNVTQEISDPCTDGFCILPTEERIKDEYDGFNCCNLSSVSFLVCKNCGYKEYDD
jgi:hypothetical protein